MELEDFGDHMVFLGGTEGGGGHPSLTEYKEELLKNLLLIRGSIPVIRG